MIAVRFRQDIPGSRDTNNLINQKHGPLAQLVEHMTFNHGVPGSSPGWATSGCGGIGRRARLRI